MINYSEQFLEKDPSLSTTELARLNAMFKKSVNKHPSIYDASSWFNSVSDLEKFYKKDTLKNYRSTYNKYLQATSKKSSKEEVEFYGSLLDINEQHMNALKPLYLTKYKGNTPFSNLEWFSGDATLVKKSYDNANTRLSRYTSLWVLSNKLGDTKLSHLINSLKEHETIRSKRSSVVKRAEPLNVSYAEAHKAIKEWFKKDDLTPKENFSLRWLTLMSSKTSPPLRSNDFNLMVLEYMSPPQDDEVKEPTMFVDGDKVVGFMSSKKTSNRYGLIRHEYSKKDALILQELFLNNPSRYVVSNLRTGEDSMSSITALKVDETLGLPHDYALGNNWRRLFETEVIDNTEDPDLRKHYRDIMGHSERTANDVYIKKDLLIDNEEFFDIFLKRLSEEPITKDEMKKFMGWFKKGN